MLRVLLRFDSTPVCAASLRGGAAGAESEAGCTPNRPICICIGHRPSASASQSGSCWTHEHEHEHEREHEHEHAASAINDVNRPMHYVCTHAHAQGTGDRKLRMDRDIDGASLQDAAVSSRRALRAA
ncbi:hypothetical protein C8Q80DRAFT_787939 [Daedaleopsis nitida]|nr:hypothetical protein C8Q80DRAFT_787939 [Daedaleopsis nitida]